MNRNIFTFGVVCLALYVFLIQDNPEVQNKVIDYYNNAIAYVYSINLSMSQMMFIVFFAPLIILMFYDAFIDRP